MDRPKGIFSLAAGRLAGHPLGEREQAAADSALEMLGYADPAVDAHTLVNRIALLRAADFVSAPFRPQSPEAPGAHFFCGTADPALLGLDAPPMSVAGCDLTPGGAFERCTGEAIEYLSQIASGIPASAGCAAGPAQAFAVLPALLELIERDAIARWWHRGAPPASLVFTPTAQTALTAFRGDLILRSTTILLDISAHPDLPVVAACSFRADGTGFVSGFGAHPDIAHAQRSAIREMVQMELGLILAEAQPSPSPADVRQLTRAENVRKDHPGADFFRTTAPTPALTIIHLPATPP